MLLPVTMVPTPSRLTTLIGVAPDAARYATARFRFGDLANMAATNSAIGERRQNCFGQLKNRRLDWNGQRT
jgi:hypothetical protein